MARVCPSAMRIEMESVKFADPNWRSGFSLFGIGMNFN